MDILNYLSVKTTDPAWNLALEQYVFERLDRTHPWLLLWQNAPAVIVGRHQNTALEINGAYVREKNIRVVRRLSGGGAVYHDLGNLNYTLITDADPEGRIQIAAFCAPVVEALAAYGVAAEVSGRNDITVAGRKFSGNAQHMAEGRLLHHGTLLFSSDLAAAALALRGDWEKLQSKGVDSVAGRICNLKEFLPPEVTLEDFRARLVKQAARSAALCPYALTEADREAVAALVRSRYGRWEWNYGASPPCTARRRERIEGCGAVEALLEVSEGRIQSLRFYGDFFSSRDTGALEELLRGCPLDRAALLQRLAGTDVGLYIHALSAERLAALLAP